MTNKTTISFPRNCKILECSAKKNSVRWHSMSGVMVARETCGDPASALRLVSSNGRILASLPVKGGAGVVNDQVLSGDVVKEATKGRGSMPATINVDGADTLDCDAFPDWRQLVQDGAMPTGTTISINAALLLRAAKAIGCEAVTITLPEANRDGTIPSSAILVKPLGSEESNGPPGRFSLIMPLTRC